MFPFSSFKSIALLLLPKMAIRTGIQICPTCLLKNARKFDLSRSDHIRSRLWKTMWVSKIVCVTFLKQYIFFLSTRPRACTIYLF